jgi:tRNA dimethylallyltransferase
MNSIVASAGAEAPLRLIAGPTGAGKSALAIALAERHDALLISADSRQVYRGFDLGTAKPTHEERARVRHEGIDVADPRERWSAARWAEDAAAWIADAAARHRPAIIAGGTGLWLRALVEPLANVPPMDPERRRALQATLGFLDTPTLRSWVELLDPSRASMGRTQLLRAAEVALLTGRRLSELHAAGALEPRRPARWVIVDPGDDLHARLSARLDGMLAAGWPDEVRALMADVPADAPAWNACGYREIRDWVEGRRTATEAREAILISTRQYAKRQRTWFRNQLAGDPDVLRLDPRSADALDRADRWLFDGGSA